MDISKAVKLNSSTDEVPINNNFKLYAGPGAGKTTFLINHIRKILSSSTKLKKTKKIACITYTNVGVETLQRRLKDAGNDVEISTIHSFLYKNVVKPYLWMLEDCPFPTEKLDGHEEITHSFSLLKEFKENSKQYWIKDNKALSQALSKLVWKFTKDKNSVEFSFLKLHHTKVSGKYLKKDSFLKYKLLCWQKGLMSHDDVIYFSYILLQKKKDIKKILRAKFPYLLLDEFQDTSPLQAEIIKMIAKEETVVGLIGDPSQAIFSFQGTDSRMFNEFELDNMNLFYLENNHRSTKQIIKLLNHIRSGQDFIQSNPENKSGNKPRLIVGDYFAAFKYAKNIVGNEPLYTLSYKNNITNSVKYDWEYEEIDELNFIFKDSNRGRLIYFVVKAIEYGRHLKLGDSIKLMKKAYKNVENFSEKDAFSNLKRLIDAYSDFCDSNIKEFYNNYIHGFYGVKGKISSGAIKEYYEQMPYKALAMDISVVDERNHFKTIHQSKGDEFNNVLVIISDENSVLFSPDMSKEEHRVFYVGFSRAKQNLFISVPKVTDKLKNFDFVSIKYI
ncbi:ATP-dependent helicase [Bacillus inaquosorum]|uniref:UvrD-helicase domain-containing protein n=1 Tax=Bacillus inaquosorum TaxID=483913 RepID=UPI00227EF9E5|nr:ATP-dependent helicase [Bacillus inaquosorum]MCY9009114.1 ATP-dependent helicase [Bacillus inaquosorum]MCY9037320.1 ATP-dependent helicase [Bacillus inaquosorum]MCY9046350.1 ATP-dependent helicase [Bacillus inaquosorum]WIW29301.1 ATP-dependent helicase [Bacillus inaquosorum]